MKTEGSASSRYKALWGHDCLSVVRSSGFAQDFDHWLVATSHLPSNPFLLPIIVINRMHCSGFQLLSDVLHCIAI